MKTTYVILQGKSATDSRVLQYAYTLAEAKHVLTLGFNNPRDSFILMLRGPYFGEGFHKYTLELINGKYKKNTRLN